MISLIRAAAGEWFYSKDEGELLYWPLPGEAPPDAWLPTVTELLHVNGRWVNTQQSPQHTVLRLSRSAHGSRDVRIENLTFAHADWTCGENCCLHHPNLRHLRRHCHLPTHRCGALTQGASCCATTSLWSGKTPPPCMRAADDHLLGRQLLL